MFDIGWSEMAVIMLVALIVIGPKDLPRVARNVGRWIGKGRALAREFQSQLEEMAREAELDKVKQEIERAGRGDLGKTIEKTIDPSGELGKAFDPNVKSGGGKGGDDRPAKSQSEASRRQAEQMPVKANGDASEPAAKTGSGTPPAERPTATTQPATERERVPAEPS